MYHATADRVSKFPIPDYGVYKTIIESLNPYGRTLFLAMNKNAYWKSLNGQSGNWAVLGNIGIDRAEFWGVPRWAYPQVLFDITALMATVTWED